MKKALKKKWVRALRSGKYKQGERYLRKGDAFCCLGVLADVHGCRWKKESPTLYSLIGKIHDLGGGSKTTADLTPKFLVKVGLDQDHSGTLISMNDRGDNFNVIADYIERNVDEN
jgi:hypothetical protein